MAKITNLSRETLNFHVGGLDKNNEPNMDHVRPGETKNLTVDVESTEIKARLNAGLISIEKATAKPSAAKAKRPGKAPVQSTSSPAADQTT